MKQHKNTPIIIANTEWLPPKNLIDDVKEERMINGLVDMVKPLSPEESIGWAELVAYLMPAVQKNSVSSKVQNIYLYCCTQYFKNRKTEIPKDLIVENLSDYEKEKLRELRLWIFEKRGGKEKNNLINALNEVFSKHKNE